MLTAHHLYKAYNLNTILDNVSFSINPGQRIGLVGPNGCGKTTLLRILASIEQPDKGYVARNPGNLRIGYLPQGMLLDPELRLEDVLNSATGDNTFIEERITRLAQELAENPLDRNIQSAYDSALQSLQAPDKKDPRMVSGILEAFGLDRLDHNQPVGKFSGGQKTRLSLVLVLLEQPQLLLLDEPTNHLDIAMLEWLEGWLNRYSGPALIVSHDRTFLDRTVTHIFNLDPETHSIHEYPGNYSDYLEQFQAERDRLNATYKDQVYEIQRIRQDIQRTKQHAAWVENTTTSRQPGVRRYAKKVARKAASREVKLDRYLKSDERVEKPKDSWQIKFDAEGITSTQVRMSRLGRDAFLTQNLAAGYPGVPPLLENLNLRVQAKQRIVITGPNGSGKTTLLRTLAGEIPPLNGSIMFGASVKVGYMSQEQEFLNPGKSVLETTQNLVALNETDIRSLLHHFLFTGDDVLRPVELLSYGERARLLLAMLVLEGCNLLLLDEPINHLDIPSRERFEAALLQFDGTILAVVHDRYFIQRFATHLWLVENKQIHQDVLIA